MSGQRISKAMPSFEGVAASSTATLRCPTGFTYHDLMLTYANALADLTEIRCLANGVVFQRFSGTQLDTINRFYGDSAAAGIIRIPFNRNGVRTRSAQEISAIGTGPRNPETNPNPIETFTVEVDLSATAAPALSATARVSQADPAGAIRKFKRFIHSPTAAGEFQIADLPRGDAIFAIHLFSTVVTDLRVEKNNFEIFRRSAALNTKILGDQDFPRTPQTNVYHYDPAEDGNGSEILFTADATDLRLTATVSGAGTITSLVEYFGPVSG